MQCCGKNSDPVGSGVLGIGIRIRIVSPQTDSSKSFFLVIYLLLYKIGKIIHFSSLILSVTNIFVCSKRKRHIYK